MGDAGITLDVTSVEPADESVSGASTQTEFTLRALT